MRKVCLVLAAAMVLASCRQDPPEVEPEGTETPEVGGSEVVDPAAVTIVGARSVAEETDDFQFEYAYPAEAGNIPELAAVLARLLDRSRAEIAMQSANARETAHDDGFPFNKFSSGTKWLVVADTPGYLSLSASMTFYTGGAHGIYGFDTLVWDKAAAKALEPEDFFTSMEALDEVLAEPFCTQLNRERGVRRGSPVAPESDEMFDQCVPLYDTTVLLGSTNGTAFDRIGVQVGPYVAGTYAEGSYEFTFPVTAEVLELVKQEYRSGFRARN